MFIRYGGLRGKLLKEYILRKRNLLLLFWPVGLIICLAARSSKEIAEHLFAGGLFKAYSQILSRVCGLLPFSLAEIIVILFPLACVTLLIAGIASVIRHKGERIRYITGMVLNTLIAAGIIFFWFMISCGVNYYRYEFAEYSELQVRDATTEELYGLCLELAERTNEARVRTGTGNDSVFVSSMSNRERAVAAAEAMDRLGEEYEVLGGYNPPPKSVMFSDFMSELNITGVYFPFTAEANVNVSIPDYSRGAVLCHELVHLKGFMREDEANFIAYLACCESGNAELEYSGLILALIISGNNLYDDNAELYYSVASKYSEGVRRDLQYNSQYWEQYKETVMSEVGEAMNDTYLKLNNQEDGTKSYGRMTDLLLAEWRRKHNVE